MADATIKTNDTPVTTKVDTIQPAVKPVEAKATEAKADAKPVAPVAKAKPARRAKRTAKPAVAKTAAKLSRRATKTVRRAKVARRTKTLRTAKPAAAPQFERTMTMTNDFTKMFAAFPIPGADKFENLFAGAGERGQELAAKSRQAAEEIGELAKANVEALAESGRIAAAGVRSIGQDLVASTRQGFEQSAQAAKTLADAGSPTEYFQLQSELVRASFDRMVSQSSKLTEQMVKLAGEAIQPISNRASVNAERVNELMA